MIFFFSYKKENLVDIVHQGFCFVSWVPVLVDIGPSNLGVKIWLKQHASFPTLYIYIKSENNNINAGIVSVNSIIFWGYIDFRNSAGKRGGRVTVTVLCQILQKIL
jgi:hypothetical protein